MLPDKRLFWAKVMKTKTCWLWQAAKTRNGYGRIATKGKKGRQTRLAHRVSWEMRYGSTRGRNVLHRCDVRNCVRPSHLFLGTQKDNIDDMFSKNRANKVKGRRHWNSKLNARKVRGIRKDWNSGMSQKDIASKFGISIAAVCLVVNRKRWQHVK